MIPTFVIFLREGIEASLIVAILLAYLDKIGQRRHFGDVFWGVAAAMILVTGGGVAAYVVIKQYEGSTAQTIFETATFLLATVVLTYMTFWMQHHSRTMASDLKRRSDEALNGGARFGLGALAFQAVGREGLETMVFTLAIIFASTKQTGGRIQGRSLLLGAALGLGLSLAIAYVIFKLGRRLNLGLFFRIIGVVLILFAAGLLADAVENMQQLGWLPILGHTVWNTTGFMSENSSIGDVFHSLLGYADQPTVLQLTVWAAYLAGSVTLFVRTGRRSRRAPGSAAQPALRSAARAAPRPEVPGETASTAASPLAPTPASTPAWVPAPKDSPDLR